MSERAAALQQMLAADPTHQLARYGLAMEYANADRFAEAMEQFQQLLEVNPRYVSAYYHGGRTLERSGDLEAARHMLEQGLVVCQQIGDGHTASEIQAALDLLGL